MHNECMYVQWMYTCTMNVCIYNKCMYVHWMYVCTLNVCKYNECMYVQWMYVCTINVHMYNEWMYLQFYFSSNILIFILIFKPGVNEPFKFCQGIEFCHNKVFNFYIYLCNILEHDSLQCVIEIARFNAYFLNRNVYLKIAILYINIFKNCDV